MYYTGALQMIDSVCRRSGTYNVKRWLNIRQYVARYGMMVGLKI